MPTESDKPSANIGTMAPDRLDPNSQIDPTTTARRTLIDFDTTALRKRLTID